MPRIIYPQLFKPISTSSETTTVDRWHQPFSLPRWSKVIPTGAQPFQTAPVSTSPETVTESRWHQPFSLPVWAKASLGAGLQQSYVAPVSIAKETTTVDRWYQPLSTPVRVAAIYPSQLAFWWSGFTPVAAVTSTINWYVPLATPVLQKPALRAEYQQAFTAPVSTSPETTTVDRWWRDLSVPTLRTPSVASQPSYVAPVFATQSVSIDKWLQPLSLPVWSRPALTAASQTAVWWSSFTPAPPLVVIWGWMNALANPIWVTPTQPGSPFFVSEVLPIPDVPIPPVPPITPTGGTGGFDAGPGPAHGFGKWFNLANFGPQSNARRPRRRETEVGRLLDELVYGEEDKALLAKVDRKDAEEASEVVREAVKTIEANADNLDSRRAARALIEQHRQEWQTIMNIREELASQMFIVALVEEAKAQWEAARMRRIAQDDADLMMFAQVMI